MESAPLIAAQAVMSWELSHSHVVLDTPPSGSDTSAAKESPVLGCSDARLTVPASSWLVRLMVMARVALALSGSVAVSVSS